MTCTVGATFELDAHGTALGGAAVARLPDGRVCFITGGIPGERLLVRITAMKKTFAEAEVVTVLTPSPDRIAPRCVVFGRCGGCQYQHVAYDRQVALKTQQLLDTVQRIGGIRLPAIDEVIASPSAWGYRNRITLHRGTGAGSHGYMPVHGREVVAVSACPIARPEAEHALSTMSKASWPDDAQRTTIRWSPGEGVVTYAGDASDDLPWRTDQVGGRPYQVPSGSFAQVNPQVADLLFALVGRWIAPLGAKQVIDAYCGAGFLGLAVTGCPVLGLEVDKDSIAAADANAAARGLTASHAYIAGDVDALLAKHLSDASAQTCVILDPPRAGCGARTIEALRNALPAWILYVSCDPATLARDLKALGGAGYSVQRSAMLDMFPQTAHFESAVLLARQP